jgi:hypothetical protein
MIESENPLNNDLARRPHAYLEFGGPGHETEYVFRIQATKYSMAEGAPDHWEQELLAALGEGWSVADRGARIEITPPNSRRSVETDGQLRRVIKSLIGENYEFLETR